MGFHNLAENHILKSIWPKHKRDIEASEIFFFHFLQKEY